MTLLIRSGRNYLLVSGVYPFQNGLLSNSVMVVLVYNWMSIRKIACHPAYDSCPTLLSILILVTIQTVFHIHHYTCITYVSGIHVCIPMQLLATVRRCTSMPAANPVPCSTVASSSPHFLSLWALVTCLTV